MSIANARSIISQIDRLESRVKEAERILKKLGEKGNFLRVDQTDIPTELRPAVIMGIETQVTDWKQQIEKLEDSIKVVP